jgi:hypothetical protein
MAKPMLLAMSKFVDGEEEQFNEWFAEHAQEVLDVPGVVAAKRYRLSSTQREDLATPQAQYLIMFEIEGDPADVLAEMGARRARGDWVPRQSIDMSANLAALYEPVSMTGEPQ